MDVTETATMSFHLSPNFSFACMDTLHISRHMLSQSASAC